MGRVLVHDEELAAGAVHRLRTRHAQHAAGVAQVVGHAVGGELALDAVAGTARAVSVGAAALDHETGDDPVEDQAVVVPGVGKRDKVAHALGRNVGIQLGHDLAAVLHLKGHDRICHLGSLTLSQDMRFTQSHTFLSTRGFSPAWRDPSPAWRPAWPRRPACRRSFYPCTDPAPP